MSEEEKLGQGNEKKNPDFLNPPQIAKYFYHENSHPEDNIFRQ